MFNQPSFLYVEDDAFSREIMSVLVTEVLGAHLTMWSDSTDFAQKLEQLPHVPDIIFLDIHIEPADGFTLLKIVRNQSRFDTARVLALTASVMATEVEEIQAAGFDGLLGKPLNQLAFPSLVERILNGEAVWDDQWD